MKYTAAYSTLICNMVVKLNLKWVKDNSIEWSSKLKQVALHG